MDNSDNHTICEQNPTENTMLISFFKNFIAHLEEEISKIDASCDALANCNKKLLRNKNKHLESIFATTSYGNWGEIFAKRLTKMAREASVKLQSGPQHNNEVLRNFRADYRRWVENLEKHAEVNLTVDHVTHMFYHDVESELAKLTAEARTVQDELETIKSEERSRMEKLTAALQQLQEDCELFEKLAEENSETEKMLSSKLIEKQNENANDMAKINELSAEIEALEAKLKHCK